MPMMASRWTLFDSDYIGMYDAGISICFVYVSNTGAGRVVLAAKSRYMMPKGYHFGRDDTKIVPGSCLSGAFCYRQIAKLPEFRAVYFLKNVFGGSDKYFY